MTEPKLDSAFYAAGAEVKRPAVERTLPGLTGELADWIVRSDIRPNLAMSNVTALQSMGVIQGQLVAGPTGMSTSLYALLLGMTTVGKQHQINAFKQFLIAAKCEDRIGPGVFASVQALQDEVAGRPCFGSVMDEFGDRLIMMTSEAGSNNQQALPSEMNQLFTSGFGLYVGTRRAGDKESPRVAGPCVSLMGVSTYEQFFSALRSRFIGTGFLNRWLICPASPKAAYRTPEVKLQEMPAALTYSLEAFRGLIGSVPRSDGAVVRPQWEVGWTRDVEAAFSELCNAMDAGATVTDVELQGRVAEIALRVATIIAAGRRSRVIVLEDWEWGRDIALEGLAALKAGIAKYVKDERDLPELCEDMMARLRVEGWISKRELSREFGRNKRGRKVYDDAIKQLKDEEWIIVEERNPPGGGRPSLGYRLA